MTAVLIAIAGAAGCLCRYGIGVALERAVDARFPLGTFAVNILGSFAIGLAMAAFEARGELDAPARMAITIGFLGGFTTYSSFALDTIALIQRREIALVAAYVAGTLVIAGLGCALGLAVGRAFR